jgi:tRNA A37 N6-isopentenylltransferase MiaA
MKPIFVTGTLLFLVLLVIFLVLAPSSNVEKETANLEEQLTSVDRAELSNKTESRQDAELAANEVNSENRRRNMQEAYSKLELSRKQLKSSANLLKAKIWGLKLPGAQAGFVSNKMLQAFAYLKNPEMLGAYFEVEDIQIELKKVKAMQKNLEEIEQLLLSLKTNGS